MEDLGIWAKQGRLPGQPRWLLNDKAGLRLWGGLAGAKSSHAAACAHLITHPHRAGERGW